ncbi:unnamed protein product [Paramecium octaurelia]|uniref:Uncharacterized protein n=1 Tax=Paramecium octaurelia TaxID=43137 RepID=A0A8S1W154_PAROT|nr:unnamed protein product [Paramecium octaurelia]
MKSNQAFKLLHHQIIFLLNLRRPLQSLHELPQNQLAISDADQLHKFSALKRQNQSIMD